MRTRPQIDPIGFAATSAALDAVIERIAACQGEDLALALARLPASPWRLAIVPHDDYTYVGHLYPAVVRNLNAPVLLLFGVAHHARRLGLENVLVFDDFDAWEGPCGNVPVSDLRASILSRLPEEFTVVDDDAHAGEHSLEALVPFLQSTGSMRAIVPILVPAMPFDRMQELTDALATALHAELERRGWKWGRDLAMAISSDAVHYGDEGWGGRNFARYGTDADGTRKAVDHELALIETCLVGRVSDERVEQFTRHTTRPDDFREVNWTWCGRYSIPVGLLTGIRLAERAGAPPLDGMLVGYGTSIDGRTHIPVKDLGMGVTASAGAGHWVGYASVGYT